MARIGGVNLPPNKRIEASLQYVFGVGATAAKKSLEATGVNPDIRVKDLSAEDEDKLRNFVEKNYVLEGQLRQQRNMNIKLLKEIGSYRGMRHSRGLPSRGQRTKTNSRTRRGNVRRTVGSGRKPTDQKT